MNNKYLIAIGVSSYTHLSEVEQRPKLDQVVGQVSELFTSKLGYQRVLDEIGKNPTLSELRRGLDDWMASSERNGKDWFAIYYTGHGELLGGDNLYLLPSDFQPGRHVSTAFPASQLGDLLVGIDDRNSCRNIKKCLIILDTCYSGAANIDIIRKINHLFAEFQSGIAVYIISATLPNEIALAGALAKSLIEAYEELISRKTQQPFFYVDQLVPLINQRLKSHRVVTATIGSPIDEPEFFPNYLYWEAKKTKEVVLLPKGINESEFNFFWEPASRGVRSNQQAGTYFVERKQISSTILNWLENSASASIAFLTGPPGSGKSAILSKIVSDIVIGLAASDPDLNKSLYFDMAISGRGKTLEDIIDRLSAFLQCDKKMSMILEKLTHHSPFSMIIDSLDEAAEPEEIIRGLLIPITSLQSVKVLIGSRPEMKAFFLDYGLFVIDLRDPQFTDEEEYSRFLEKQLEIVGSNSQIISSQIKNQAFPNYLIGRLIIESFQGQDFVLSEGLALPNTVTKAYDQFFKRFGPNEQKVKDVLRPLAWQKGIGLPWDDNWPQIASAMSGKICINEDIKWVLAYAQAFVIEVFDLNRSVYKLFHESLADYFRKDYDLKTTDKLIVETIKNSLATIELNGFSDWRLASPYVRQYLSAHAVSGNCFDVLANDVLFLAVANVKTTLTAFQKAKNSEDRGAYQVFHHVYHLISSHPLTEVLAYIRLAGFQFKAASLINHPIYEELSLPWCPEWAIWHPQQSSILFGHGNDRIINTITFKWRSRQIIAMLRTNGSLELWDVVDGVQLKTWTLPASFYKTKLDFWDEGSGKARLMAGGVQFIALVELETGKLTLRNIDSIVSAVCFAPWQGKMSCISVQNDRHLMVVWSLSDLSPVFKKKTPLANNIYCLTVGMVKNKNALLSAGDFLPVHGEDEYESHFCIWSLDDLSLIWKNNIDEGHGVYEEIKYYRLTDKNFAVLSSINSARDEIYNLDEQIRVYRTDDASTSTWIYEQDKAYALFSISLYDYRRQKFSVQDGNPQFFPHNGTDQLVEKRIDGFDFVCFDHPEGQVLVGTVQSYLAMWRIDDLFDQLFAEAEIDFFVKGSLAADQSNNLVYLGGASKIYVIDIRTGQLSRIINTADGNVNSMFFSDDGYLAVGMVSGIIQVFSKASNYESPELVLDGFDWVGDVKVITDHGIEYLIAAVKVKDTHSVKAWYLSTGKPVTMAREMRLFGGQEDKAIGILFSTKTDQGLKIGFGSRYSFISVVPFYELQSSFTRIKTWDTINPTEDYFRCSAVYGEYLIVGTQYGWLFKFDSSSGNILAYCSTTHVGAVNTIGFFAIGRNPIIVTGGSDGLIKFWTASLELLSRVDLRSSVNHILIINEKIVVKTVDGLICIDFGIPSKPLFTEKPKSD